MVRAVNSRDDLPAVQGMTAPTSVGSNKNVNQKYQYVVHVLVYKQGAHVAPVMTVACVPARACRHAWRKHSQRFTARHRQAACLLLSPSRFTPHQVQDGLQGVRVRTCNTTTHPPDPAMHAVPQCLPLTLQCMLYHNLRLLVYYTVMHAVPQPL